MEEDQLTFTQSSAIGLSIVRWLEKRGKIVQPELTVAQKESLRETFEMIDTNGSGSIDRTELYDAFDALGITVSRQRIAELLGEADKDGSGSVEFMEFLHLMTSVLKGNQGIASPRSGKDKRRAPKVNSGLPLQLLATAYRRRKTLHGVMTDQTFRRRLMSQNEEAMAREAAARAGRRRKSVVHMGMDLMNGHQATPSQMSGPMAFASMFLERDKYSPTNKAAQGEYVSSSGTSTSSESRRQRHKSCGIVLEIDVGMDFSDTSEDFESPYWRTRREEVAEKVKRKFARRVAEVEDLTGHPLPSPQASQTLPALDHSYSCTNSVEGQDGLHAPWRLDKLPLDSKENFDPKRVQWAHQNEQHNRPQQPTQNFISTVLPISHRRGGVRTLATSFHAEPALAESTAAASVASSRNSPPASTIEADFLAGGGHPVGGLKQARHTYRPRDTRSKSSFERRGEGTAANGAWAGRSKSTTAMYPKGRCTETTLPKIKAAVGVGKRPKPRKDWWVNHPSMCSTQIRMQAKKEVEASRMGVVGRE